MEPKIPDKRKQHEAEPLESSESSDLYKRVI